MIKLQTVDSTQNFIKELEVGTVVLAKEQTEGRGRKATEENRWVAPKNSSLLMSYKFTLPDSAALRQNIGEISVVSSIALQEVLKQKGFETIIKWPNDLLVLNVQNQKFQKVAGIICELLEERDDLLYFALGVGVNLFQKLNQLPSDTKIPATSLFLADPAKMDSQVDHSLYIEGLAKAFLNSFTKRLLRYQKSLE